MNHLLDDPRFWAAVVAATLEVDDPDPLTLAFGVDVDEAWHWFEAEAGIDGDAVDQPLPSPDAGYEIEIPIARVEVALGDGVRLRFDAHFEGFTVSLDDGSHSGDLGEFSGHYRLPLLRPEEALRLADVAVTPPDGSTRWRPAMATALVIAGSWDGDPTPQLVSAVASAWLNTGLVSQSGADRLAELWRIRASEEATTWALAASGVWVSNSIECTRADTMAIEAYEAGLDPELDVTPRAVDLLLSRALAE